MQNVLGLKLLLSVLSDVAAWRRDLKDDIEFSKLKTQYLVGEMGDMFFYEHLPKFGKAFDKALSSTETSFGDSFCGHRFPYSFLMKDIFDDNGVILDNPDVNAIFFVRQLCYMFKKVNASCSKENILKAVREFHDIEDQMVNPTNNWVSNQFTPDLSVSFRDRSDLASNKKLVGYFQRVADVISASFPVINPFDLIPRHGPGAVSDKKTGTDKYTFPCWPTKLDASFPYDAFASHCFLQNTTGNTTYSDQEHPAKLIAVPKTPLKPRLIASEPSYYQYCQQAVLVWIRDNLPSPLRTSIDFVSQEPSRKMALHASLTGKHVTIDLSSASDRMSCWAVERFFRKNPELLTVLHAIRSRYLEDNISDPPEFRVLRKYANQGSAVTFPLQSIIYASACIAALLFERESGVSIASIRKAAKQVRVFGDDLIVPKISYVSTMRILNHIGFKVNMAKTHVDGWFRESCGMDAYKGYNVTPVYINNLRIERTGESLSSFIDMSNNAHRAGLFHLGAKLRRLILDKFRDAEVPVTRRVDLPCLAFSSFVSELFPNCRFDKKLQQHRVRSYCVRTRQTKGERSTDENLLQYFVERPSPDSHWEAGYLIRSSTRLKVEWVPIAR